LKKKKLKKKKKKKKRRRRKTRKYRVGQKTGLFLKVCNSRIC